MACCEMVRAGLPRAWGSICAHKHSCQWAEWLPAGCRCTRRVGRVPPLPINPSSHLRTTGLIDARSGVHMGNCAELCAEAHSISRQQQDDHAIEAFERARAAQAAGHTAWEIVPVPLPSSRQHPAGV